MLSVRLAPEVTKRLQALADRTGRTKIFMPAKRFSAILKIWRMPSSPLSGLKIRQNGGLYKIWRTTLTWTVEWDDRARRELRRLDGSVQRQILRYLRERIATDEDPRRFGIAFLTGNRIGLWRYRVGDYRLICQIEDDRLVVVVLAVGHRREVYRQ